MLRYNAKRNKIYDWESPGRGTKTLAKHLTNETKRDQTGAVVTSPSGALLLAEVFFRSLLASFLMFLPPRIALARCNRDFYFTREIGESANYDHYRIRPRFVVDRGIAQGAML